ncbi:endonuclease/exonuclease/phosphatase family protein [Microbacterium laevaniformans]|uniref:endonuclease/exonuclease/phosphatase family protein n=1 Tax=Microbacterium laevaniformans TaxID=36807 RepID=UPI00362E79DD
MSIKIAAINIASPSLARSHALAAYFPTLDADLIVLTETSTGEGSAALFRWFYKQGWAGRIGECSHHERGTAVFARFELPVSPFRPADDYLPGRCLIVEVQSSKGKISVVGMYLPTRGNDPTKLERKLRYMNAWGQLLQSMSYRAPTILIGDLNIVPQHQKPVGFPQLPFEYAWMSDLEEHQLHDLRRALGRAPEPTWISPQGEGYTFDHALANAGARELTIGFDYRHDSRTSGVTDHSAIVVEIDAEPNFTAAKLSAVPLFPEQQTLF